jgi:hypothetical protein
MRRVSDGRSGALAVDEIVRGDDTRSLPRPTRRATGRRSVRPMQLKLWIVVIGLALLVLALCGWVIEGLRWALHGGPVRRPATA